MNSNQRLALTLSVLASIVTALIIGYAVAYTEPVPLSERVLTECESVSVGSDVGPILQHAGYDLEFDGLNAAGAGQFIAHSPGCGITIYEDGSGEQFIGGDRVRTFDEDTFYWSCFIMGNKVCK